MFEMVFMSIFGLTIEVEKIDMGTAINGPPYRW